MALTVTGAKVKERAALTGSTYDSLISGLISDLVPAIEYMLAPAVLADTGNAGLQATLNLAALEFVAGELLAQLGREPGMSERIAVGPLEIGAVGGPASDPSGLKQQAVDRLRPYLRADSGWPATAASTVLAGGGAKTGDEENTGA